MAWAAAQTAKHAYLAGVAAVDPTRLVKAKVRAGALDDWFGSRDRPAPIHVVAIGKAAARMVWGLVEANVPFTGIGASPRGTALPKLEGFDWHIGEHPVPGPGSLAAGEAVLRWAARVPVGAHVLALVSGGGSACCEAVDVPQHELMAAWQEELRAGRPVEEVNQARAQRSRIKGGRLADVLLRRADVRAWVVSDTADGARSVASGPFWRAAVPHEVLADADTAAQGAASALAAQGISPFAFTRRVARLDELEGFLAMAEGLGRDEALLGSGEAAYPVPAGAPAGGRCQHVALAAAGWSHRRRSDRVFLAGATDGIDGTTREAGAWSVRDDADPRALAAFDAHRVLAARDRTFRTGASGTNVGDLWISLHAAAGADLRALAAGSASK